MIYASKEELMNFNYDELNNKTVRKIVNSAKHNEDITDWDRQTFKEITSTHLSDEQEDTITIPEKTYPYQESILAIHWHPEFIPMRLIAKRVSSMFPNCRKSLIIPTNHNCISSFDNDYYGVEVDCFAEEFNRKVQLLIHFSKDNLKKANVFISMLNHTLRYRSKQFNELVNTILDDKLKDRIEEAVQETGADNELIDFVKCYTKKLKTLVLENKNDLPVEQIKNRLLIYYFEKLLEFYDAHIISQAKNFIKSVKSIVKQQFKCDSFYSVHEIIEEANHIGAGIVVPHPEQFWPILLAEYDVDGYEVWNPQSREYTEFLINIVNRQNRYKRASEKRLLVFMGDDTHMSEKIKDLKIQDKEKVKRELGLQPPRDDFKIQKSLGNADMTRSKIIDEYLNRLG